MTNETKTKPTANLTEIPHPALLPEMIAKDEVPAMAQFAENGQISKDSRQYRAEQRKAKNDLTKLIAKTAVGAAAAVTFVVAGQEIAKNQTPAQVDNVPENIERGFQNSFVDQKGDIVQFPGYVERGGKG